MRDRIGFWTSSCRGRTLLVDDIIEVSGSEGEVVDMVY